MRAFCVVVTDAPRSPRFGKVGAGPSPRRKALEASISPLATSPLDVWKDLRAVAVP